MQSMPEQIARDIPEEARLYHFAVKTAITHQLSSLALIVVVCASVLLVSAGGALRIVLPAFAFATSAYMLSKGRLGQYVTFCLWLFLLTPGIRRVVDVRVGWETVNTLMLTPYAALSLSVGAIPILIMDDRIPARLGFLSIIGAATYGLLVAVLVGPLFSGLFDYVRWVLPPCLASLMVINRSHFDEIWHEIVVCLLIAVPLLSLYGIYQYLAVPEWDAFWMIKANLISIGAPFPYQLRVFSTMNSPGVFASFLFLSLVLILNMTSMFRWFALILGFIAFALTLVRTSWIALSICAIVLLLRGTRQTRLTLVALIVFATIAIPTLLSNRDIQDAVVARIETFGKLSSDTSYIERFSSYSNWIGQIDNSLLGEGLGNTGTYRSYADARTARFIDSGVIEIATAVGPIVGIVYFIGLFSIVMHCLAVPSDADGNLWVLRTIICTFLLMLLGATVVTGETGFQFWLLVGLCLAHQARDEPLQTRPR